MTSAARARIGIVGFAHEVNAFADPITRGHGLEISQTPGGLAASWEAAPLVARLQTAGVEVVDLPSWEFGASGPLDGEHFRTIVAEAVQAVRDAGPLDGLAVLGHGAGRTTDDLDPDGTYLAALRAEVGGGVPIGIILDFHANVSHLMCASVDVLVGYRTNPHIDIAERLVELADHMVRLLGPQRPVIAKAVTPLVLPQIAQLTTEGEPMGDLRQAAERMCVGDVWNVSVFGGFSLGDSPDAGVCVCVTADDAVRATAVVNELASLAWSLRDRYRMHTTPLAESVALAAEASAGRHEPLLLADVADNPGGGAPGNSTVVLAALAAAGVDDVMIGLHCDAAVVGQAWDAGIGAEIDVVFNRDSTRPLAVPFEARATVLALVSDQLVPTKGMYAGSHRHTSRCCALLLHVGGPRGVRIAMSAHPVQCADDDTLLHVGLDPTTASVVVVKSRGHFRAGFAHLFRDDQIIEVGAPGVATCELHTVQWQHLPRPSLPLDQVDTFEPVAEVFAGWPA